MTLDKADVYFVVYWNMLDRGWNVTTEFNTEEKAFGAYEHLRTIGHVAECMIVKRI